MALSNLPAIIQGINNQIATATGLGVVLDYRPENLNSAPLWYLVKDRWERIEGAYQEMAIKWIFQGVVAVPRLNNRTSEQMIVDLTVQILGVSGQSLSASGSIDNGQMLITGGEFVDLTAGKNYYGASFTIEVVELIPYDEYAL